MKNLEKNIGLPQKETVITNENLVKLSQILALRAVKNMKKYAFDSIDFVNQIHKQLIKDIYFHKELDNYSQAYDLVQEASIFLFQHLGEKLGDSCIIVRNFTKKNIPIGYACIKEVCTYLRKEMKHGNTERDDVLEYIQSDFVIDKQPENYKNIVKIANEITKTKQEKQILYYCYNGVEIKNIAQILNISIWNIYKRRTVFRKRYLSLSKV